MIPITYKEYMDTIAYQPDMQKCGKHIVNDDIIAFDIECCNFFIYKESVYSINDIFALCEYDAEKTEAFFDKCQPGALPYMWMLGIKDHIIYGRELPEFLEMLDWLADIIDDTPTDIWIHNINYEYSFLREVIPFDDVFFTDARKPLFATYKCFTFRCSYRLTHLSLAKWGENIGIPKLTGDLDYHALYTPLTDLDEKALGYCWRDIEVMMQGIAIYKKEYKHISKIPYTQTGIPRREIKKLNAKNRRFLYKCMDCQPKTPEQYKVQNRAFAGGLTLCNPAYAGRVLKSEEGERVVSYDKKSAYPFAMLQKYPASAFIKVTSDPIWDDGNHHICLIEFKNLRARYDITPLSSSKRILLQGAEIGHDISGIAKNNGKVIRADKMVLYVTELDFDIIKKYYKWNGKPTIHSHWIATSGYMDKHIVTYMLQLYADKTLLKRGDPVIYMRKKETLNSLYGMAATALTHPEIIEKSDHTFDKRYKTEAEMLEDIRAYQDKPFKNVLPYSWGLYITAYQRHMLMDMALKAGIDKLCYTDTDSLKGIYGEKEEAIFAAENERIIKWTDERCKEQNIDPELTRPKTTKGEPQFLGTWENDEVYHEIKFLGAKRYAYKKDERDVVHITIAGVPKVAGMQMQSVDELREGLTFDVYNSRKNLALYIDGKNPQVTMPDGYKVINTCGCCIRPTSYKLTLTQDYRNLIKSYLAKKI